MEEYCYLLFLRPEPPEFRPAQQSVIGSFQGLVLLRIPLQPGIVLEKLLHVCLGALHLQHLAAQLRPQVLAAALRLLQQGAQLAGLGSVGGPSQKEDGRLQKEPR